MKFGLFIAPFHALGDDPTLSFERDLELIDLADHLGFDEAWVGEHHSTGVERIADPFQMLAASAMRTRRIKLGTGVVSLPYHHPLMVADRIVLLDHLSRGRAMLGVGPGALISDADMMGIDPATQRSRMNEALDAIIRLLAGDTVTMTTQWFVLREAQLALLAYGEPIPVSIASTTSPSGMIAAGRHGSGVLSLSAGLLGGKRNMRDQWQTAEKTAAEYGTTMNRAHWRMVLRVHVAGTHDQAVAEVSAGRDAERSRFFKDILGLESDSTLQAEIADDCTLVGTPDEVSAAIARIQEETDGFGGLLIMATDWADPVCTRRSLELFARFVAPRFRHALEAAHRSASAVVGNRTRYRELATAAIEKAYHDAGRPVPEGTDMQSLR